MSFQSTRPHGARPPVMASILPMNTVFQSTRPHGARLRSRQEPHPHAACFNPRARTGRDLPRLWKAKSGSGFNPRARTGRDSPRGWWPDRAHSCFNPRARTGRDELADRLRAAIGVFQSTRPHGARPTTSVPTSSGHCFNPRARTGRDDGSDHRRLPAAEVSIHAPARGATVQGAGVVGCRLFQSTRPHGARRCSRPISQPFAAVSIHAPARGATLWPALPVALLRCFNPRARTGRDTLMWDGMLIKRMFQSTRPHGARRRALGPDYIRRQVSIHAPARGATAPRCA